VHCCLLPCEQHQVVGKCLQRRIVERERERESERGVSRSENQRKFSHTLCVMLAASNPVWMGNEMHGKVGTNGGCVCVGGGGRGTCWQRAVKPSQFKHLSALQPHLAVRTPAQPHLLRHVRGLSDISYWSVTVRFRCVLEELLLFLPVNNVGFGVGMQG
jgi:hypothetical protein